MSAPNFSEMTQEQLSAWYVDNVGYDLAADDPSMTLDAFRELCREMHELHTEDAVVTDDPERKEFLDWLLSEHGLTSEWQPERNCFADFPAHLAYQAWRKRGEVQRKGNVIEGATVSGVVCGGDVTHNTVNVRVEGVVPSPLWTLGSAVQLSAVAVESFEKKD